MSSVSFTESVKPINEETIFIRRLAAEEILRIYTEHSIRHFPADELKPVSSIERMLTEGIYRGYGIFHHDKNNAAVSGKADEAAVCPTTSSDGALLCYALFTVLPKQRNILLDYFAVMEDFRNLGIGSLFLKHFTSTVTDYDGILIEVENPDYAEDEADLAIRRKRIGFYERNGIIHTGITAEIFSARYCLLFLPVLSTPSLDTIYSDFNEIYRHMVSPEGYQEHVRINRPGENENI